MDVDVIPDSVKLTMVLEAAADIKGIERDLRQVEVLKGQGVEGAGSLEGGIQSFSVTEHRGVGALIQ